MMLEAAYTSLTKRHVYFQGSLTVFVVSLKPLVVPKCKYYSRGFFYTFLSPFSKEA